MKKKKILCLLLSLVMVLGICPCYVSATEALETRVPRIFVMGDSMAADYPEANQIPQMGWGQTLKNYFDESKLVVVNRARGGASSRNFYNDPFGTCWTTVWGKTDDEYLTNPDLMQEGDYLIFTFGANDVKKDSEVSDEDQMTTTEEWLQRNADHTLPSDAEYVEAEDGTKTYSYKWYMKQYVLKARERGAIPIMITPPERRVNPSSNEHAVDTTIARYKTAVIELAEELNTDDDPDNDVVCPDTEEENISNSTLALYRALGDTSTGSRKLFVHLAEGQYPLYEGGTEQGDNTHFRDFGAVEISGIIVEALMKHSSTELDVLKGALKTVSTPFVYDSDHNTAGTAIKQTDKKTKGTTIYPRAQFINTGEATTIQAIMAGYDANGKMTNVSFSDKISVEANSVTSFDISYTMPNYAHSGKTKIFVWKDLNDSLIPLSSDVNEQKFLAGSTSGNLLYEEDFDDSTEIDSKIWRVTQSGAALAQVSTLNGSPCMFIVAGKNTLSDAGNASNKFFLTKLGTGADANMETVLEADVKLSKGSIVAINRGSKSVFQIGIHKTSGFLHYGAQLNEDGTYTTKNTVLSAPPEEAFHLKVVINEKEMTAKVYINGIDWLPDDASLIAAPLDTAGCYEKLSLTGGDSGTYVDNLTFYRQPITSAP